MAARLLRALSVVGCSSPSRRRRASQHLLFVLPRARQVALRFERLRQIIARRQGGGMFFAQPPTGLQHLLLLLPRARQVTLRVQRSSYAKHRG